MSFDAGSIGPKKQPAILEAQNMKNNGGGGNLGYFQRGGKRKGDEFVFEEEDPDCFIKDDDEFFDKKNKMTFLDKLRKLFFGK